METKTYKVYKFDELSEEAQAKAIENNYDINVSYDWWTMDDAYIDHLIEKISTGEYDPELLSDAEKNSIEHRLRGA